MKISDENFINELKNKNSKALEFLIDNYSNLIFKVVISVLGNERREEAKECVNDIVFKVWKNIHSYDESKTKFSSWLIAVSKYNAIDYRRKLVKLAEECNIDDIALADNKRIEDEIIAGENKEELFKVIYEMGKPDKDIFIRRYFIGETINEISEKLGLTRSAVDNRLFRGRKLLKERLSSIREEVI